MTSCSSEVENDDAFTKPIPIEFYASLGNEEITSRSTVSSSESAEYGFVTADRIRVAMSDNFGLWGGNFKGKLYKPSTATKETKLTAVTASDAFYWYYPDAVHGMKAWSLGTGRTTTADLPTSYEVYENQDIDNNGVGDAYRLSESDFLYAPAQSVSYNASKTAPPKLTMYHQNAQVCFNLVFDGTDLKSSDITGATISSISMKGDWSETTTAPYGKYSNLTNEKKTLTLKRNTSTQYRALVIPQDIAGKVLTFQNSKGLTLTYKFEANDVNKLKANQFLIYTLSISESVKLLKATLASWTTEEYTATINLTETK